MIRPLLRYGATLLHAPARVRWNGSRPTSTPPITDAIRAMYGPGIGLWPRREIGIPLRMFVVDLSIGRDQKGVMVNPEWVERDGVQLEEGCLSVPGFRRHRRASGRAQS